MFFNNYDYYRLVKMSDCYGSAKYIPKRSQVIKNKIRKKQQQKSKRKRRRC